MFVRIFHDLWESSLMSQDVDVRWVFITLLKLADERRSSMVDIPVESLARHAAMSVDRVEKALQVLMSPDDRSRSELEDGRRLICLRPDQPLRGWEIVNWESYAQQIRAEHRRNAVRAAVARHRAKAKGDLPEATVINANQTVIKNSSEVKGSDVAKGGKRGGAFVPPSLEEVSRYVTLKGYAFDPETFVAYYASKGWKVGAVPMKDWRSACVTWQKRNGGTAKTEPVVSIPHGYEFRRAVIADEKTLPLEQRRVTEKWTPAMWKRWEEGEEL